MFLVFEGQPQLPLPVPDHEFLSKVFLINFIIIYVLVSGDR